MMSDSPSPKAKIYWKENIRLVLTLLSIWFLVSFVMAILFVDIFDNIRFFGFKLGFWMAQQGSIYCFVVIIFIYVYKMNKIDHKYQMSEKHEETSIDNRFNQNKRSDK
jgi:putative solute:sodium symporter small subunit